MLHALLVGCASYAVLCLALLVANRAAIPRLSRFAPAPEGPLVSLVVPARNEQRGIGAAVRSLLAQDYPSLELVVVDDRSTDGTRAILAGLEAEAGPRLTVLAGAEPPPGWLGKPHALFQGARAARGDLILFVDADVRFAPETVSRAVGFLQRRGLDLAALLPQLEARGFWENVLMPNLACAAFFGPSFLANARRPRWLAVGGGAGNLVRRSAYEAVGGHAALRASVVDDVHLAVAIKKGGFRAQIVRAEDFVSVRMYEGFREVWDGFTKNVAYAVDGGVGLLVFVWLLAWTTLSLLPPAVLAASAAGAAVPPRDVWLAAASCVLLLSARLGLAAELGEKLWPAATQPVMAVVWAALFARSFWHRVVRRTLVWRGRSFDARDAGF